MYPCLAVIHKVGQYSAVFPQQSMDISDKIAGITVKPVVVIIPALIRTEFLIGAAANNIAAIETFSFHSTKVLIKI